MTQAYPLLWPEGWERNKSRGSSQFKTTLPAAIKNVMGSIRLFAKDSDRKMENVVISSSVSLMDNNPVDPGVAVYFTWDGISTCIAVDRYKKIEENLQAIHHCIEAERTKLRHGGINLVRAAFRGYAALPPPSSDPYKVLMLAQTATIDDVENAYRMFAKKCHPDQPGGSTSRMQELTAARDELRRRMRS